MSKRLLSIFFLGVVIALFIPSSQGRAQRTLREIDFAYGRKIHLESETPLYRFFADAHIYKHVTDKTLADVRIFNHQKQTVPLQIRRREPQNSKSFIRRDLPIFPLHAGKNITPGELSLNFSTNAQETHLTFNSTEKKGRSNGLTGFIVDLGQGDKTPERIEINLTSAQAEYRLTAKVSYSTNLNDWKVLVSSSALVKMTFNGELLERNHIDLPPFSGRYLNISLNPPFEDGLSAGITGIYTQASAGPSRPTIKIKGDRVLNTPAIFTFDSNGFFPVDRIQLRLPQGNSLVKARISSRANAKSSWQHRTTAIFYRLKIDAVELENVPIEVTLIQDPFFRVEIIAGSLPTEGPGPELELLWHPHECAFVASGDPPFVLAYGNADLLYEPQVVDDLLKAIGHQTQTSYVGAAHLENPQVLGGDDRLTSSRYSGKDGLRAILWGVLLLSVAGLALMAYRLYGQITHR